MKVREAREGDLPALLALYLVLNETGIPEDSPALRETWARILSDPGHHLLVAEEDGELAASCVCVIVPNLTRGVRPYALIENVVTRRAYRRRGYATACLDAARELAEAAGCYKIMLLTGSKDPGVLEFYRRAGYDDGEKTGFVMKLGRES